MCGIAGIVADNEDVARRALPAMVGVQTHRGPDDAGEAFISLGERTLGLGHRRLSIIDLSPLGHQPMSHPQTNDLLVYNGEIYNFQRIRRELKAEGECFHGTGDSEVLLHGLVRHGSSFVERLEGMYAFAFFNRQEKQLLLARDPVGIKPLYVACLGNTLLFASEVRGVMASGLVPRTIDPNGVAGFLAYGAVQEPHTIFRQVQMFPAGCWQVFDLTGDREFQVRPTRYWRFPEPVDGVMEADAVANVRETLDHSVCDHLISDVPVGVFLSSGLDSTITASLASRHSSHLRTFTVGFEDQPDLSESLLAAGTAKLIGSDHTDIQITGEDAQTSVDAWIDSMDQPSIDGLNTYLISKAVRAQDIVVALSGLGGDELFGGYASFSDVPRAMSVLRKISWIPTWGRRALATAATTGRPTAVKRRAVDMAVTQGGLLELYLRRRRVNSDDELAMLGIVENAVHDWDSDGYSGAFQNLESEDTDAVAMVSQLESRLYMGNTLLRDSDANGMAHSLEIRVPLLDRRMLDHVYTLPGRVRLPSGRANKHLLRVAFRDYLRSDLLEQKKRGFTLPIGRWLTTTLRDLGERGLAHLKSMDILRSEAIDDIWKEFLSSSHQDRSSRPFALCVLGLYGEKMGA